MQEITVQIRGKIAILFTRWLDHYNHILNMTPGTVYTVNNSEWIVR